MSLYKVHIRDKVSQCAEIITVKADNMGKAVAAVMENLDAMYVVDRVVIA